MSDQLYKVLEDQPAQFKIAIYSDYIGMGAQRVWILTLICALNFVFFMYVLRDVFEPLPPGPAPMQFGNETRKLIFAVMYILSPIVIFIGAAIYGLLPYSGKTDVASNFIRITPDNVTINGMNFPRDGFRSFAESNDEQTQHRIYSIFFTAGVSDIRMESTFSPKRVYERTEIIRLLNGALQRIPPASAAAAPVSTNRADEDPVFL